MRSWGLALRELRERRSYLKESWRAYLTMVTFHGKTGRKILLAGFRRIRGAGVPANGE